MVELKEKIGTLERRGGYHVSPTTSLATVGSYSQPAFSGKGSGLVAQVSPQPGIGMSGLTTQASPSLGRGMSGLAARQMLTPPSMGRGLLGCIVRSGTGSLSSTPTPYPGTGSGLSTLVPGQRVGAPAASAGQAQGPGRAMDVEGSGHAPVASTVTIGASSTTTNQDPAQAGSHLPPQ